MKPITLNLESQAIVTDGDVLPDAEAALFDPEHWRGLGLLSGSAPGRGTSWFIDAPFGPVVLRRYLRGGWVAKVSHDRYHFTRFERSRPFLEFDVLQRMHEAGLRVPKPVAALCDREGRWYRGALMTHRIEGARALADRLGEPGVDWVRLGRELREYHDAGMDHTDLNARNILLHDVSGEAWLIDFDRCTFRPGHAVNGRTNLARLLRSLHKLWPAGGTPEADFALLSQGYGP